jgi:hypothetical protein
MKHTRLFWCETCDNLKLGKFERAKAHLQQAHGLGIGKGIDGTCEGLSFLDGHKGRYSNTFRWTFGRVKLLEVSSGG